MKIKNFTFAAVALMWASAAFAQTDNTFSFTDEQGNVIADGTEIIKADVVDDPFGATFINSGLWIKNNTDAVAHCAIKFEVTKCDSGSTQVCGIGSCYTNLVNGQPATGTFYAGIEGNGTPKGVKAGASIDLMAEWFPMSYGNCIVSYQLVHMKYNSETKQYDYVGDGEKVTINYTYADPAGVDEIAGGNVVETRYFDLNGREIAAPADGIFLKETKDNSGKTSVTKVVIK